MEAKQPQNSVAIIGAGPGGLVAARWLIAAGLEPTILEAANAVGGQWNPAGPGSATWSGMRTNTSRTMSRFSDLDHSADTPAFPAREDMLAYLEEYASHFDLHPRVRIGTRVARLEPSSGGWLVTSQSPQGERIEWFAKVVVASGAEGTPVIPPISGLDSFAGQLGVSHTAHYAGLDGFRGHSVLVAGCSISALEIASELALGGGVQVTATYRRQRYVLPKIIAGVPTDNLMFTRAAALTAAGVPPPVLAQQMLETVTKAAGRPEQYGAPAADIDIFAAGITQCQHFLPAVADGRVAIRPWIRAIEGKRVLFADGSILEPEGIIFGTGYRPKLSFFSAALRERLENENGDPKLFEHTLHPDFPSLAFLGLYNLVGPKLPVLELQARWISRLFADQSASPSPQEMHDALSESRARGQQGTHPAMHALACLFARRAGVEPDPDHWPGLKRALLFGPLTPASFRLEGPHALPNASLQLLCDAAAFGAVTSPHFTNEEESLLELLLPLQLREAAA